MDVERLGLVDEWSSISSHLQNVFLLDFPNSSVPFFDVSWNVQVLNISLNTSFRANCHYLNGTVILDDLLSDIIIPVIDLRELTKKMWVDYLEFAGQNTSRVDVVREGLNRLIVSQNLGSRGCWHW
jgi:hypothetical protein